MIDLATFSKQVYSRNLGIAYNENALKKIVFVELSTLNTLFIEPEIIFTL